MKKNKYNISAPTDEFCADVLQKLTESSIPFIVGGAHALRQYSEIYRDTKDLDIFCKASDALKFLQIFENHGFLPESRDARWIVKVFKDDYVVDFIFNSMNGLSPITDDWFGRSKKFNLFGVKVPCLAAEDILLQKGFIMDKHRFDGADIYHLILKQGKQMDWEYILRAFDQHWELLLSHLMLFHYIYPSERDCVPSGIMDELLERLSAQRKLPTPIEPVCRGPLISQGQYDKDIKEWKYKTITYENL